MKGRHGFTLLEVVIAIAVISILASVAVPYAAQIINQSREGNARKEMEELSLAIVGDPKVPTGGFVGDVGRLPLDLAQLNVRTAPPGPAPPLGAPGGGFLNVKVGWYGPYINTGFDPNGYLNDPWGTPYAYGNPGVGQIRSAGKDRTLGTADDIMYPPNAVAVNGSLVVNLFVWDNTTAQFVQNPTPAGFPGMTATVTFYHSANGTQTLVPLGTPGAPPYRFLNYHAGLHAVQGSCTLPPNPAATGQAVVYIPGNNQQAQLNLYLR